MKIRVLGKDYEFDKVRLYRKFEKKANICSDMYFKMCRLIKPEEIDNFKALIIKELDVYYWELTSK